MLQESLPGDAADLRGQSHVITQAFKVITAIEKSTSSTKKVWLKTIYVILKLSFYRFHPEYLPLLHDSRLHFEGGRGYTCYLPCFCGYTPIWRRNLRPRLGLLVGDLGLATLFVQALQQGPWCFLRQGETCCWRATKTTIHEGKQVKKQNLWENGWMDIFLGEVGMIGRKERKKERKK